MTEPVAKPKPKIPLLFRVLTMLAVLLALALFGLGQLHRVGIFPGPVPDEVQLRNSAKPASEAVFVASADGTQIRTIYIEASSKTADMHFLYFGGNAEAPGHPQDKRLQALNAHGDVLTFDYRNFGETVGQPTESGLYQDARAVYAYAIADLDWNPRNVIVYGRSLGGAPAIRLASELLADERMEELKAGGPPAALFLESPFTNIPQMGEYKHPWIPRPDLFAIMHLNNLKRAPELELPVLHFHGTDDKVVPFELAKELHEAMPLGAKQFLVLANTGHLDIWDKNEDLLKMAIEMIVRRSRGRDSH
ncbi:alpha/beta hydrolase [Planctomycetota bacterium]|nr:alpha/beta hydrolase [Planctomycetota bacterium]